MKAARRAAGRAVGDDKGDDLGTRRQAKKIQEPPKAYDDRRS